MIDRETNIDTAHRKVSRRSITLDRTLNLGLVETCGEQARMCQNAAFAEEMRRWKESEAMLLQWRSVVWNTLYS